MQKINYKKTCYPKIKDYNCSESKIVKLDKSVEIGVTPSKIPFIKPKLLVKEGDLVDIGSPLFFDKRDEKIQFLSPGGGVIQEIKFGKRRVIDEIIIKLSDSENRVQIADQSQLKLDKLNMPEVIETLIKGGLWQLFQELPFRDYPDPATSPPQIIIYLNSTDPSGPDPLIYLKEREELFLTGLKILEKLSDKILISLTSDPNDLPDSVKSKVTHQLTGGYPVSDPGLLLYKTREDESLNNSWIIYGQDLTLIGELFTNGTYPVTRIYTSMEPSSDCKTHFVARAGTPVNDLLTENEKAKKLKLIQGGLLKGVETNQESYMGFMEQSLYSIIEKKDDQFFGFLAPGINKVSFSRTFLSIFKKNHNPLSSLNGETRACINCGTCLKVCPVDIMPQFTYKAIYGDETEEALEHGLLDCVECGLCSYSCPCKIELTNTFKQTKINYYKDQG